MEAIPGKYDPKRNDYAYNIKYIITPYKVNELVSNYFSKPKYNGVHKQYNYWFTGLNTQVLSYEQSNNYLYTQVMTGAAGGAFAGTATDTFLPDTVKRNFQPRSGESSQQASGRTNEINANPADWLYSIGDVAKTELTIVGDPAWLQQGEVAAGVSYKNFDFSPFNPDGTINFEAQQILFEILINTPRDYDLDTGLMDPNTQQANNNNPAQGAQPGAARQSYVYIANECLSEFNKGKFTQLLKGQLKTYFPDQTSKVVENARPTSATTANTTTSAVGATTANTTAPTNVRNTNTSAPQGNMIGIAAPQNPTTTDVAPDPKTTTTSGTSGASNTTQTQDQQPATALPASAPKPATSDGAVVGVPTVTSPSVLTVNPVAIATTTSTGNIPIDANGGVNTATQDIVKEA